MEIQFLQKYILERLIYMFCIFEIAIISILYLFIYSRVWKHVNDIPFIIK